ncbi:MAG: RHS repeat domain-containing protein [Pirellulaceae bacterium]
MASSISNPEGGVLVFTYDANGRKKTMADENGNVTTYNYRPDGQMESMVVSHS